jgi:predicted GIY-YIG superfamily endonuclease
MIYHVYGLFNEKHTGTYIGYTKDLTERLYSHRKRARTSNTKVYRRMREVGGDWKMEVLETHECSKKYAKERERYYKELMGDLNEITPGREPPEYYLDNKEKYAEYGRNWRKNNPEKAKAKEQRANDKCKLNRYTCKCGVNLRWSDRHRHEKTKSHIAYETQNKNI